MKKCLKEMCFFVLACLVNEKWEHVVKTTSFTKHTYRSVWSVHLLDVSSQGCGGSQTDPNQHTQAEKTSLAQHMPVSFCICFRNYLSKQKYIYCKLTRLPDSGSKWPLRYQTVHKSSVRNVTDCFHKQTILFNIFKCLLNKQLEG